VLQSNIIFFYNNLGKSGVKHSVIDQYAQRAKHGGIQNFLLWVNLFARNSDDLFQIITVFLFAQNNFFFFP